MLDSSRHIFPTPLVWQCAGLAAAMGGLIHLVLPGISAPDPIGAMLMCVSGIAWGVYSIRGKGVSAPVAMTAVNFARSAIMAIIASAVALSSIQLPTNGCPARASIWSGYVRAGISP